MLTDTRDILPQIFENVQQNGALIEQAGGSATVQELDWNEPDDEVREWPMIDTLQLTCLSWGVANKRALALLNNPVCTLMKDRGHSL